VGEWKVAPFLRTMLVLRVKALVSGRVTSVLRGLEDMFAGKCGVHPRVYDKVGGMSVESPGSQLSKCFKESKAGCV